jgi:hypothetical protein
MYATENLDKFGETELKKAIKILTAISSAEYIHPYWQDGTETRVYFNERSSFVFVQDAKGNTMAINEANQGRVEGWYCNPDTGTEGFLNDLEADLSDMLGDDYRYFKNIIDEAYNIYGFLISNREQEN